MRGPRLRLGCGAVTLAVLWPGVCRSQAEEASLKISEGPSIEHYVAGFGIVALAPGQSLGPNQHMVPLNDDRPRLNPLVLTEPTPGCDLDHSCFLTLGDDGYVSVYSGTGPKDPNSALLKHAIVPSGGALPAAAAGAEEALPIAPLLTLQMGGDVVLRSMVPPIPRVLWAAGSKLPSSCLPDSACAKGSHLSFLPDGSLALFLGLSAAGRAYLEVGLPAVRRFESCLWHNDFAGPNTDAPKTAMEAANGACYARPIFSLISFPSSGATFTLDAVTAATNHSVYTCSKGVCDGASGMGFRALCDKDSWDDLGLCPMPMGVNFNLQKPPPGKGIILKNHVIGTGEMALCAPSLFQKGLLMAENGVHFSPYGFARLFRDPFDNMVGRMHHRIEGNKLLSPYTKDGFLAEDSLYAQHDIWSYIYWHLNANIALKELNAPTKLFDLRDVDADQATYVGEILHLMGYTESDVSAAKLRALFPGPLTAEEEEVQKRLRYADEDLPVHIDFYDAATVRYIADALTTILDGSACLTRPYCIRPPRGFRDWDVLMRGGKPELR